jgi:hypothetical protein
MMHGRGGQMPRSLGRGAPQENADDEGEPMRLDKADGGVRRARENRRNVAACIESTKYVRPHAASGGCKEEGGIGTQNDTSQG